MSMHTPGPWHTQEEDKEDRGFRIMIHTKHGPVAYLYKTFWANGQDAANARLITAAPDMLAALKQAVSQTPEASDVRRVMSAAIEKAEDQS